MSRRRRWAVLCVVGLAVAVGLSACTYLFSDAPVPTLILGEVMILGGRGELMLSVNDMPDGGLASAAVVLGGITYDVGKISNVTVEALYGFEVLAEQFAGGLGGFVVAHACAGLPSGGFVKLHFDVTGNVTLNDFGFTKGDISLGDDNNDLIVFEMTDAYKHYAK